MNYLSKHKDAILRKGAIIVPLLILAIFLAIKMPLFYEWENIRNLLVQTSGIAVMAFGITFVLISGCIDLSMPAIMWLSATVAAIVMRDTGLGIAGGLLAMLAVSMLCALINGIAVAKFKMLPFIATLAMQIVAKGIATLLSKGYAVPIPAAFCEIGNGRIGPVPVSIIYMILIWIVLHLLLSRTAFGRQVYTIGINAAASENCGISLSRMQIKIYLIGGICVFFASVIISSRLQSSAPAMAAETAPLDIICSAVLGGVSINGGSGKVFGVLFGAIILMAFQNILNLFSVDAYTIMMLKGLLIIGVTSLEAFGRTNEKVKKVQKSKRRHNGTIGGVEQS